MTLAPVTFTREVWPGNVGAISDAMITRTTVYADGRIEATERPYGNGRVAQTPTRVRRLSATEAEALQRAFAEVEWITVNAAKPYAVDAATPYYSFMRYGLRWQVSLAGIRDAQRLLGEYPYGVDVFRLDRLVDRYRP